MKAAWQTERAEALRAGLLTINGECGVKRTPYVPAAFGRTPEKPSEALDAAAALLEEEGRWRTGEWYRHDDTTNPDYQDDPYCNGWGSCAEGALQLVTMGTIYVPPVTSYDECSMTGCTTCNGHWAAPHNSAPPDLDMAELVPEMQLFLRARLYLIEALDPTVGDTFNPIAAFNDHVAETRADVIGVLRQAQQRAEQDEQGGNNTEDNK